jgi:hypothetical protein
MQQARTVMGHSVVLQELPASPGLPPPWKHGSVGRSLQAPLAVQQATVGAPHSVLAQLEPSGPERPAD